MSFTSFLEALSPELYDTMYQNKMSGNSDKPNLPITPSTPVSENPELTFFQLYAYLVSALTYTHIPPWSFPKNFN